MKNFSEYVKKNYKRYGALPFWSWNDKLEEKELRRQIGNMKDLGMRGFFMHARTGLVTEYMSDEWFEMIRVSMDEAEKLGMEAWAYDENGWPSGFCGGKLLSDKSLCNLYLRLKITTEYPDPAEDLLGVYLLEDGKLVYLPEFVKGEDKYYSVYLTVDDTYVDLLGGRATEEFIKSTHEVYREKLGDDLGKRMPGFFTDEPQYCRFAPPFSHVLEEEFFSKYGYSIREKLLGVFCDFDGADEFRYDYYNICHELYIKNFVRPLSDWCRKNGVKLTGHTIEETNPSSFVKFCGSVMEFYEYQDIPGIDYLGRGLWYDSPPIQLSSVCDQLGKREALTETFAAVGWEAEPTVLKQIADYQYVGGVNLLCQHLYPYSQRGVRKGDYPLHYDESLPWQKYLGYFNRHYANLGCMIASGKAAANVLMLYPLGSAYMAYLDTSLAKEQGVDIKISSHEMLKNVLDNKFYDATRLMTANQVQFHYMDEALFAKYGRADKDTIVIGNCTYDTLVIPYSYTVNKYTAEQMKIFAENGGKILVLDRAPDRIDGRPADLSFLKSSTTLDEIIGASPVLVRKAEADSSDSDPYRDIGHKISYLRPYPSRVSEGQSLPQIRVYVRDTEFGRIYFCSNLNQKHTGAVDITLTGVSSAYEIDIDTLEEKSVAGKINGDGDVVIRCNFDGIESKMFVSGGEYPLMPYAPRPISVIKFEKKFSLDGIPENALPLDFAEISYDGVNFEDTRAIVHLQDKLLYSRYSGKIWLKHKFTVREIPKRLEVVAEPMGYLSFSVNGEEISLAPGGKIDRSFLSGDISSYIRKGENEIVYSIDYYQRPYVYYVKYETQTESLKNCLTMDTELAPIYLFGEFKLATEWNKWEWENHTDSMYFGKFEILPAVDSMDLANIVREGYPFFAGAVKIKNTLDYKAGDPTDLCLGGRFALAVLEVNGAVVERPMMFTRHIDIAEYLKEGENEIKITLYNSNFNLLGPHHIKHSPVPGGAGPDDFSFDNAFCDKEESDRFDPAYGFIRFGIDEFVW